MVPKELKEGVRGSSSRNTSSLVIAIATVILVIITGVYAILTYQMVSIMKETFNRESRPYITFSNIEVRGAEMVGTDEKVTLVRLHLQNNGKIMGYYRIVASM